MPINPAIALGVKGLELPDPLAQYSRVAAIQQAQQQNALAQMQMQEYARSLKEGEEIRNRLAAGANFADPTFQNFMLGTKTGRDALQRQAALVTAQTEEEKRRAELRQKVGETYRDLTNIIKNRDDAVDWLTKFHTDPAMQNSPLARFPLEQLTQRIPSDPEGLDNWIKQSAVGYTKWVTENKPTTHVIDQSGQKVIVEKPGFGGAPTTVGTYADVPLPSAVEAQRSRIAKAGATNVNVSTEKKYGERFGGLIAESDAAKLAAAEKAPEAAATADRVMGLIGTGKVITGTGANARLQIAKALNLAGGTDSEKIKNTEVLISSLAETTLGAIKSSNLGAGQGFTDKDREFLEKARAGQITYDATSLTELARLSRLAAEKSADAWNTRARSIPSDVLKATGISSDPIIVPKRGKSAAVRPSGVGADWTLMTDANGNSAWVSPDLKSHVEVGK